MVRALNAEMQLHRRRVRTAWQVRVSADADDERMAGGPGAERRALIENQAHDVAALMCLLQTSNGETDKRSPSAFP
jgi:hypothetical protein